MLLRSRQVWEAILLTRIYSFTFDQGIQHEVTAAYTHEHNGFLERNNRIVVEAMRSILTIYL